MKKIIIIFLLPFALLITSAQSEQSGIVLIGNPDLPKINAETIAKIYTGKVISVSGIPVKPVNSKSGTTIRNRFLQMFLNQDDENYIAYWAVRRYIGRGTPPPELNSSADVVKFVQSTPGAIGYIDVAELKPDMNVVSSR